MLSAQACLTPGMYIFVHHLSITKLDDIWGVSLLMTASEAQYYIFYLGADKLEGKIIQTRIGIIHVIL